MHIAFAGCRGIPGLYSGFETAATEIGARLVERGHLVTVYCRRGYGDESHSSYRGVQKVYLPLVNLRMAETLSHTFLSLLHSFVYPPDVLIVMNPANGPLLVIPRLRGTPVAINVDGLEWQRRKWPWVGRRYLYFACWLCTKVATAIIADSLALQALYQRKWAAHSHYASYGANIEHSTQPEILREYGLERDGYFLVVARLEPENNIDLVIQAFEGVRTNKKLVIVGGTSYGSHYLTRLRNSITDSRVMFAGPIYDQPRLTELMCHSFAYVHGHMVGGTNPILLKAMGCGARILFADVEFNAEVVRGAGISFPLSAEGARGVFQQMVDDTAAADQCRTKTRDRVREAYTWDMVTDQYEELCVRLAAATPRVGDR